MEGSGGWEMAANCAIEFFFMCILLLLLMLLMVMFYLQPSMEACKVSIAFNKNTTKSASLGF